MWRGLHLRSFTHTHRAREAKRWASWMILIWLEYLNISFLWSIVTQPLSDPATSQKWYIYRKYMTPGVGVVRNIPRFISQKGKQDLRIPWGKWLVFNRGCSVKGFVQNYKAGWKDSLWFRILQPWQEFLLLVPALDSRTWGWGSRASILLKGLFLRWIHRWTFFILLSSV